MAYATLADLELAFGCEEITQLSDRDDSGSNDVDVVETKIAQAEGQINSYLSVKYELPITSVSDNLIKVTCDIARYLLHKDGATEEVIRHYKEAVSWLKDIASGRAVLMDANTDPVVISGVSASVGYFSNGKIFTAESLDGY